MHTKKLKVEHQEGGDATIDLGGIFTALIITGVLALFGAGASLLSIGINSARADDEREELEARLTAAEDNQIAMDESLRNLEADTGHANKKLDALLTERGITERIPRPKLRKSTLVKPEKK